MNELRYAMRTLRKQPAFAAAAIVILALGIGANTAIFSLVHGVLLRPLPYPEPDRLVAVWEVHQGTEQANRPVTDGNYVDWRGRSTAFEALGAYGQSFGMAVIGPDMPVEVTANRLSPSLFGVLRADAMLGRVFLPEDGEPGGEPVALLSYGIWRDQFGADPAIIGSTVQLEESPFTVVGVMPRTFAFPSPEHAVWIPLRVSTSGELNRTAHRWRVVGRLNHGVTVERAQAEMDGIANQLRKEHPAAMEGWSPRVIPYRADLVHTARPFVVILYGIVGLLLLIACANVASLFLARALRREHEFALRGALGGTRWHVVRQLLAEAGVLAFVGVLAGVALSAWGIEALRAFGPGDIPLLSDVRLDAVVLAYAAVVGVVCTLVFGLAPAWRAGRTDLATALKARRGAGSKRHGRLRAAVLVGQLALSMVLLVGAGLLTRSFITLQSVDYGFQPERLLAVGITLPYARYGDAAERDAFIGRVVEDLTALPGIDAAGATTEPPIIGFDNTFSFMIAGRPTPQPGSQQDVQVRLVTPTYFAAMQIPIIGGRSFSNFDREGQPDVVIVNRSFARQYWPDGDAVGQRIGFADQDGPWLEVVGVAGDTRHFGLDRTEGAAIYAPHAQKAEKPWWWMNQVTFMIRTHGEPLEVIPAVRRVVWALDERLPMREAAPVTALYAESGARRRFAAGLTIGFAGLATVLGLFGIFGVVSYSVAQREREFGVRVALGAEGRRIVLSVLRHGLVLAGAGVALGAVGALFLTRFLRSMLFGVTATDPLTFASTALLLVGVALLASYVPARRAARIDPMEALRSD